MAKIVLRSKTSDIGSFVRFKILFCKKANIGAIQFNEILKDYAI